MQEQQDKRLLKEPGIDAAATGEKSGRTVEKLKEGACDFFRRQKLGSRVVSVMKHDAARRALVGAEKGEVGEGLPAVVPKPKVAFFTLMARWRSWQKAVQASNVRS